MSVGSSDAAVATSIVVCGAATAALVYCKWRPSLAGQVVSNVIASTAFVVLAVLLGAASSSYGRWVLAGLVFSWLGDALLLSRRSGLFLGGMAAFLAAHVVYAVAFAVALASNALPTPVLSVAFVLMGAVGLVTLRWLWPYLQGIYKGAVGSYVLALSVMCVLAIALGAATGSWLPAVGALVFAASDIAVARDRFVAPGFVNPAVGLPLYYAAQVMLALSVSS
jgi:uncharacterized membrane protein YhhN